MREKSSKARNLLGSRWLPWSIAGLVLVLALIHEIWQPIWIGNLSRAWQAVVWVMILLLCLVIYVAVTRIQAYLEERDRLTRQLAATEGLLGKAYQWLEAILRVNQKFVEAGDENEVIEPVLRLLVEISGAKGASFVPLDEHGQAQAALSHGEIPASTRDAWVEHLASPEVRERCRDCEIKNGKDATLARPGSCPLLSGPFSDANGLLCLPVRGRERDFGVLTLFVSNAQTLEPSRRDIIQALLDETALGLDGVRLRRRELAAIRQMQVLRQNTDLTRLLESLLESVYISMDAEFALLVAPGATHRLEQPQDLRGAADLASPGSNAKKLKEAGMIKTRIDLVLGDLSPQTRPFLDGILQGIMVSGEPVSLGDVGGASGYSLGVRSLLAAPLMLSDRRLVGVLAVGSRRSRSFHPRQLALLQTVAGQAALIVQNADLMAELEYKTMIQERARLAREIHDGLAQMIGFLKLQAAQLRTALGRNDLERARQTTELLYNTLSETYQDARQAIDGLRVSPAECGIEDWLHQIADEFQETTGAQVDLLDVNQIENLPSEVHAQLIRIVQEALSNVRKHAHARQVWIACQLVQDDLLLEVRDDGDGFEPESLSPASRYGLRGMRERAELLGATFDVISRLKEGTIVRIRLPMKYYKDLQERSPVISGERSSSHSPIEVNA
jgi:two-component system nitrate/nitrite sensor histidine kinase NarX